jgi:hypothetical protein
MRTAIFKPTSFFCQEVGRVSLEIYSQFAAAVKESSALEHYAVTDPEIFHSGGKKVL